MRMKWLCMALAAAVCLNLAGCAPGQKKAVNQNSADWIRHSAGAG